MDVDEKEFLRFLDNRIPSAPIPKKQQFVVPELQSLVVLLTSRPGWVLEEISLGGHDVLLSRDRSREDEREKRRRTERRRETCRLFFHRTWSQKKEWDVQDSMAFFVSMTSSLASLEAAPELLIVVLPGKVTARARNDGFSARAKHRVLPLALVEVEALDMSVEGQRHAPKVADADVVMQVLGCEPAELLDLPLLSVEDPAVLFDLDALIGSYVHCPPSHTSYRLVASALED
jgi:hypothetical protein